MTREQKKRWPWGWFLRRRRRNRDKLAVRKWNADLPRIREMAGDDVMHIFKWSQLVWQEIGMWIALDEKVDQNEFDWMCKRRGFDAAQRIYLVEMLEHLDLNAPGLRPDSAPEEPCNDEDDCDTPMWCRTKDTCPKREAAEQKQ